jgi:hypothetical protein
MKILGLWPWVYASRAGDACTLYDDWDDLCSFSIHDGKVIDKTCIFNQGFWKSELEIEPKFHFLAAS